jgi:Na+-translocating ferredoxin:NAD+ oxidoreductase RnfE subunit
MPKATTPGQDLRRGIWGENPVLVQMLGSAGLLSP